MSRYFRLYEEYDDGQREWVKNANGRMTYERSEARVFSEDNCPIDLSLEPYLEREYLPEDQQNQL